MFFTGVAVELVVRHGDLRAVVQGKQLNRRPWVGLVQPGWRRRIIPSESERAPYVRATLSFATDWIAECLHTDRRWGPSDDLCRQAAYHAGLAATSRGRGFDPIPVPSEGGGRCHAYAESAFMVYRARPSAECGDPGRADCRALHSLRDTPPLTLDDGHSRYLSGIPYLGTIRGAARRSSFALLAETTGWARGTWGRF